MYDIGSCRWDVSIMFLSWIGPVKGCSKGVDAMELRRRRSTGGGRSGSRSY